jgi:DNA polymerase-1
VKRTLLIDGDIFAYHAAAAVETVTDFGEQVAVTADKAEGVAAFDKMIVGFREKLDADEVVIALSCPTRRYFRHDFLPTYKAGRGKKPILLGTLKAHIAYAWNAKTKPNLEADDVLGIMLTNPKLCPGEKIVVTLDKDLRTVPGLHWNPDKEDRAGPVHESAADYNHLLQTLVGDKTDGYAGLPGVGPVKAAKILEYTDAFDPALAWAAVVAAYEKAGLTAADALVQARVARICRHSDYDYKNQKAIPWNPPSTST